VGVGVCVYAIAARLPARRGFLTPAARTMVNGVERAGPAAAGAARSGPRFGACRFLLLAGYENLTAPLFALARQCKAEVAVAAPGGSP
jgi:hypothetical protein